MFNSILPIITLFKQNLVLVETPVFLGAKNEGYLNNLF